MSAEPSHGRLPWPAPAALDDDQRAVYDSITGGPRAGSSPFPMTDPAGRLHGPFNAMLANPPVGMALQALGAAVRFRSVLTARQREVAALQVALALRSDFQWYAHEQVGRAVGLTDDEIASLRAGEAPSTLDGAEQAVHRAAGRLVADEDLDDGAYGELAATVGTPGCADLVVLVGYYRLLALGLRAFRVPLPAGVEPPFP